MPWCIENNEWVECDTLPSDAGESDTQLQHDWEAGTDAASVLKVIIVAGALLLVAYKLRK